MEASAIALLLSVAVNSYGQYYYAQPRTVDIKQEEVDYQSECFQRWWGVELDWKFDNLPAKGTVPDKRMPYSGYHYPDHTGGTLNAMRKYDAAFHRNASRAHAHERWDIQEHKEVGFETRRAGLFGFQTRRVRVERTPDWYGHCNGWTAAAIRHAEPQRTVYRNGVRFTPGDIKGLLAEVYMYSETEFLGGIDTAINPGLLHVVLSNWVGRGEHPIGMESELGKEVWNYPIYGYASSSAKRSEGKQVEVKSNVGFVYTTNGEHDKAPAVRRLKYLHYLLDLDEDGKITGGQYYRDSARIDMLWTPLQPRQGGEEGNERGNPYLNVEEVLALWRESVPEENRKDWLNIDPTDEDRVEVETDTSDSEEATAAPEELDSVTPDDEVALEDAVSEA